MRKPPGHIPAILVCMLLILQSALITHAQLPEEEYTLKTRKDGLPHNYITGIVQDDNGYIWLSTLQGLSRYDGTEFFPVSIKQFGCTDEYGDVWRLKYFGNNEIGITTGNGAYIFNSLSLRYQSLQAPSLFGNSQTFNKCRDIEKINENMYATSTGTGLYIFNRNGLLLHRKDGVDETQKGTRWFQYGGPVERLAGGILLQENAAHNLVFDPTKRSFTSFSELEDEGRLERMLITPEQIPRPRFFADPRSSGGIFIFNKEKNTLDQVQDYHKPVVVQSLPLPFSAEEEINWQSKLCWLNDSTFAITLAQSGFYIFNYSFQRNKLSVINKRFFQKFQVTDVFADQQKDIWVATNQGLLAPPNNRIKARQINIAALMGTDSQLQLRALRKKGAFIYAGGAPYTGLLILDQEATRLIKRVSFEKLSKKCDQVNSIIESPVHPNHLWIGTSSGMVDYDITTGHYELLQQAGSLTVSRSAISYAFTDSKGWLWFRVQEFNHVMYFDPVTGQFHDVDKNTAGDQLKISYCFGIGEDQEGNIWLGGDGLSRWNRDKKTCDEFIDNFPFLPTHYNNYEIFHSDREGFIWMSTAAGILKYNPVTRQKTLYSTKDGMPSNISLAYAAAGGEQIFVHTYKGMGWLDLRTHKIQAFTERDGIPQPVLLKFMGHCYDQARREYLYVHDDKLVIVPGFLNKNSSPPLSLNISMLHIYHDTVLYHPADKTLLPYHQNDLGICFNAVNFIDPENHVFAYRLIQDNESHWIATGRQSTIYLNDLSPGHYRLQVKLTAANKRWPEMIREISIIISPPYWKKTWFILLTSLLLVALIALLFVRRIRQVRQKANLDKLLAQTEMKALHAQMNPHFVFNCLNSINEMILLNENQQASHYLSKFAHLIRATLEQSTREWVSLAQTIDYLQRYIELEKIRRNDFAFTIETDPSLALEETFLPPMLIQPLLENAIWHGKNKDLEIIMRFYILRNQLICEVIDNGVGIEQSISKKSRDKNYHSIGISNIQQRIQLLSEKYNLKSDLTLLDRKHQQETGTIATLRLPFKTSDA